MFKRAVFTDEVSQDFAKAVEVAQEYDLDGLEIRSVWDKPPQDIDSADIDRMKQIMSGTDLVVCSIASPFYKCDIDNPTECTEHLDILRRCCAVADAFGCDVIRGFTFWRKMPLDDYTDELLKAFEEPVRILEENNKRLAIENEASTLIGTGERLARFLERLGTDRVGSMWDAANCIFDLDEQEQPFPEGYEAIKNRMIHMHLKDARRNPETGEPEVMPIGDGDIDFRSQFRKLVADGYDGFVSLETHWRPTALDEETLNRPGGADFSEGGEYASRLCLDNWDAMLSEIGLK
jgi:sugar phosphate isomerase/epimerase